jgi:MFS family permease
MNKIQQTFRALKYRNYRLFFAGQGLSAVGALMQQMAQGWLVYRITNSPLMLGIVAFAGQAPAFFLTPVAGLLSDRHDRRRIILIADIVQMMQAFILAALILTKTVQPWHIIVMSVILGTAQAFEMTTRHSFVPQMVDDPDDLGTAIALN